MTTPLSILDLSPISVSSDAPAALRNTGDLARHAERWGFKRFRVAEHHFVAVASSAPAVLVGGGELRHAGGFPSRTHRSGHAAAQPAPAGQDGGIATPEAVAPDCGDQVDDILALLAGTYEIGTAVPGQGSGLTPWVFGSSKGQSARVAAARGVPFVASYHITPGTVLEAIEVYRNGFTPSPRSPTGTRAAYGPTS